MEIIDLCHAHLNALYAGYQGTYTKLNALNQLRGDEQYSGKLDELGTTLTTISTWFTQLGDGNALDFFAADDALSVDAQHARSLFVGLQQQFQEEAEELHTILAKRFEEVTRAEYELVVAAVAQQAYGREHYIKGLVFYGDKFNREDVADRWRQQLLSCQNEIRVASGYFFRLTKGDPCDREFYETVWDESMYLPFIKRSQICDLYKINGMREGGFDFTTAGFTAEEAQAWQDAGVAAESACYWKAYGLDIGDMRVWVNFGMHDPAVAATWHHRNFPPVLAVMWHASGYSAAQADEWRRKGIDDPTMLTAAQNSDDSVH